jgi:hypothetical protein
VTLCNIASPEIMDSMSIEFAVWMGWSALHDIPIASLTSSIFFYFAYLHIFSV